MNAITRDVIDVEPKQAQQYQAPAVATPAALVQMAVQNGASMEQLEKLLALQERWEAGEARKAYTAAMAAFKKNPPTIIKEKDVAFSGTAYSHATLGNVVRQIVAALADHDISHSWSTAQLDGGNVVVTCTLTHSMGHSESVSLQSAKDDSGKKNNIQALGSAITYLQRYTLLSITGLATEDQDDDGKETGVGAVAAVAGEQIAETMIDSFRERLLSLKTDQEAKDFWATAGAAILATKDRAKYLSFRDEVAKHRHTLAGGAN